MTTRLESIKQRVRAIVGKKRLLVNHIGSSEEVRRELKSVLNPKFDVDGYLDHLTHADPFEDRVGNTPQCLSINDFMQYFEHNIDSKLRQKIEKHLNECDECKESMTILQRAFNKLDSKDILEKVEMAGAYEEKRQRPLDLEIRLAVDSLALKALPAFIPVEIVGASGVDLSKLDKKSLKLRGVIKSERCRIVEKKHDKHSNQVKALKVEFYDVKAAGLVGRVFNPTSKEGFDNLRVVGKTSKGVKVLGSTFARIRGQEVKQ